MISTDRAIIVEGKYDKIKLASVVDGVIICTDGFRVFKDREKAALIRHYADTTGIIILTDSDSAGFKIRNHIKGIVKRPENVINVYIPDVFGKERRKNKPSKEGKLGVEGIDEKTLEDAFRKAGIDTDKRKKGDIDKVLLYELGLTGTPDASERRKKLLAALSLPELMTANPLIDILNTIMTADELRKVCQDINDKNTEESR
ncbi:MAG: DUF4093 domain-containing protein [Oscillospiraceae bacterium]|nr:DUF4093 domain-containing protein [Oscillospiraceae bacterium]